MSLLQSNRTEEAIPFGNTTGTFGAGTFSIGWVNALWYIGFPRWVALTAVTLIAACFASRLGLKQPLKDEDWPTDEDPKYWMDHHTACCDDAYVCCCGLCCMSVRWAHTMNLAGILTFWRGFLLISVVLLLNIIYPPLSPQIGIGSILILFYFRQKLREKFDIELGDKYKYLQEFAFLLFCPCCAIVQDAYAVESAYKLDLKEVKDGPKSKIPLALSK